jgi:hypothetical protein
MFGRIKIQLELKILILALYIQSSSLRLLSIIRISKQLGVGWGLMLNLAYDAG